MHEKLIFMKVKISYSAVKKYLQNLKRNKNIFIRVHSNPGNEAQIDFGYVGYILDNSGKNLDL